MLVLDVEWKVYNNYYVDTRIACTFVQIQMNLTRLDPKEEREMFELFHVRIKLKRSKLDCIFDLISHRNSISIYLVDNIVLEVHDHAHPYHLGWMPKMYLRVTKKCKFIFTIDAKFIGEVEVDMIPLDVCKVIVIITYMYMRDVVFTRKEN